MKRLISWLGCALLLGCAHAPAPKAAAQPQPPAHLPAAVSQPFELPSIGLSGSAPATMERFELDQQLPDGPMHVVGLSCNIDSEIYMVARYFREGRDRATDATLLENTKKLLKPITHEAPITLGELSGLELEGTGLRGGESMLRSYAAGDGFWLAQVTHRQGKLDRARAAAFLKSLSLSQPWSVHAFPEAHFSVLFPDGAVRIDQKALKGGAAAFAEGAWIGGAAERSFAVWAWQLSGARTADERLDAALSGLIAEGNRVVWQSPLSVDGAVARDVLMQSDLGWMRLRIIVTSSVVYLLQAAGKAKPAVLDDSVTRFLASFREY